MFQRQTGTQGVFFIGFVIYWQMNISILHVKLLPLSNTGNKAMRLCNNCYSLHGESSLPMKRAAPTHDNLMWQYDEGRFNGNRIFKMDYVLFTHLSSTLSTGIRRVTSINTIYALKSNPYEEVSVMWSYLIMLRQRAWGQLSKRLCRNSTLRLNCTYVLVLNKSSEKN